MCKRVSNPENQNNTQTAPKLIKYLLRNKHFSPFEMVNLVFEIKTTRDISRQLLRHDQHFQEFSQRYSDKIEFVSEYREARLQDSKNRQNSIELTEEQEQTQIWFDHIQENIISQAKALYEHGTQKLGIAKEQMRCILPEGLTLTTLYTQSTLRNFIHYVEVREKNGTQKEHIEIALAMKKILIEEVPELEEYFKEKNAENNTRNQT